MAKATRTYTVLQCDWCGSENEDVVNRKFELEGKRRQLEACGSCWPTASVKELLDTGRQMRGGRRVPAQATGAKTRKAASVKK